MTEAVEVTQADREAADRYFSEADPSDVFHGTELAEAFARHRIAHHQNIAAQREDAARQALEAAALEAWSTRNGTVGMCDCEDCISQNIRAIDPARFRGEV